MFKKTRLRRFITNKKKQKDRRTPKFRSTVRSMMAGRFSGADGRLLVRLRRWRVHG
jgi:hypothetical protein